MQKSNSLSLNEKDFILAALLENTSHRIDARHPFEFRNLSLEFLPSFGSVQVSLGQTRFVSPIYLFPSHVCQNILLCFCRGHRAIS